MVSASALCPEGRLRARSCRPCRRPACCPANAFDFGYQQRVAFGSGTAPMRLSLESRMLPISRRADLQNFADRLDPEGVPMFVDEVPQDLNRRSNSAWAKNALASFRISLARRSSLTSRSSSLTRCASAVVTPPRMPVSTSCRWTQPSKVCGTQPIFGAIESTAAHSDGYSPRCSCTMRTARSRTSGENLVDLFMAPSSQELEPPQNPGRFSYGLNELLGAMLQRRTWKPKRRRHWVIS